MFWNILQHVAQLFKIKIVSVGIWTLDLIFSSKCFIQLSYHSVTSTLDKQCIYNELCGTFILGVPWAFHVGICRPHIGAAGIEVK
jgi:hypothetical protein